MICRRRLNRLRTPKTLALLVVVVLLLGILMTYKTLNGQFTNSAHNAYSLPSMERRKPRYKAAHSQQSLINNHLQFRTFFNQQFKSGLKVPGVREVISLLYPTNWKSAKEPDEVAIILKDKMLALNLPSNMSCQEINTYQIFGSLGQSSRKFVERLEEPEIESYDGYSNRGRGRRKLMAVKSQGTDVKTKVACMKQVYNADFCGPMGNYLLMREIFLLHFLQHPNLIRTLGYCLRGDKISMELQKKGLVMVMEAGAALDPVMITSMSWAHRVQLALDAASLMEYLELSPVGSVGLPHVLMKDFVVVGHTSLKLTDLDEALLGDRLCSYNSDCLLQGTSIGVECQQGQCLGLNQRINLRVMGNYILDPLLQPMPPEEKKKTEQMLDRVKKLDVLTSDLVDFLHGMAKKYPLTEELHDDEEGYQKLKDKAHKHGNPFDKNLEEDEEEEEDEEDDDTMDIQKNGNKKSAVPSKSKHSLKENPMPHEYIRQDSSNFPGQHDYTCRDSRVLWGCVMTFDLLESAMEYCSDDAQCRSFVVFSSRPETESKMTVVFKNRGAGSPHVNLGTTLFLKRSAINSQPDQPQPVDKVPEDRDVPLKKEKMRQEEEEEEEEEEEVNAAARKQAIEECIKRSKKNLVDALHSREKRLMAHMGLKGKSEKDWKRAVVSQGIANFTVLRPLEGVGARGGSMLVVYNTSTVGHFLTRAKFMVEAGPKQNHVAFALVYQIDRLLGLYHTPPTMAGHMGPSVVKKFSVNDTFQSTFQSLTQPDGSLRGLFVAPTPKVVKRAKLGLDPVGQRVSEVVPFDRLKKMQLEYVLLWWLGHIAKPGDLHRGFKGHLIHVDGDQGFQEPAVNYNAFFNHCQFPNVAYKMLSCFRCDHSDHSGNKICFLGQEVVRRLEVAGFKLSDLHIDNMSEKDYPSLINGAASKTMEIIDKCIDEFGREAVLY